MTKDMTNGSPMKLILGFSVPLLFGFLFQQFYNLMDTLIVGRFLGVDDLAAVGSTGSVNFLIIGFCMGVCNGFAIPLAHKFGAGDYKGMRGFMMNAIYLSAIFAVVMTIVTVIFCMPILELMRTPENIIDGAYRYIVIIFWGACSLSCISPDNGPQSAALPRSSGIPCAARVSVLRALLSHTFYLSFSYFLQNYFYFCKNKTNLRNFYIGNT